MHKLDTKRIILQKNEVDLFWIDLSSIPLDLALLSPDERQRHDDYINPSRQIQFAKSRSMLRRILTDYLPIPPQDIRFEYGKFGKPSIMVEQNHADIHFNLSHSGDWFVCAVTQGKSVGVDIEVMRPILNMDNLAQQQLSLEKWQTFQQSTDAEKQRIFFDEWTRREATFKATESDEAANIELFALECPSDSLVGCLAVCI